MILIAGDSWGCGEWEPPSSVPKVSHTGLEHYFGDAGYSVINASQGFIGNHEALDRLEKYIVRDTKIVIWFVTCAIRRTTDIIDQDPYKFATDRLIENFARASDISTKSGCEILIIGGLCDIPEELISQFSRLNFIVPSVCSLFVEKYPQSIFGDISAAQKIQDLSLSEHIQNKIGAKHDLFKNNPWFPDDYHLGRDAYYKLFQLLLPYVQSKI